jgi:histidinol-phosphate aminotransferase
MSRYWSSTARRLEPYIPGEQPRDRKYIKLNTNENPYPPSPRVVEAIKRAADDTLRLYPDPSCEELRAEIAGYYNIKKDQVFVGNGSDELLAFSFQAFFEPGKAVAFPDITYSFYPVYCSLYNLDFSPIPLDGDFSVPVEKFFNSEGGVVIPNPNAPTGKFIPVQCIREIVERNPDNVVIIDEAYVDFGGESVIKYIDEYPNLLVIQTLSKARSLAGLRVGFAAGNRDLIEALDRVKNSFNSYTLNRLSLVAAADAFRDDGYFRETRQKVIDTRERTVIELKRMGFEDTDSKANFVFISHPSMPAAELFLKLRGKGILVRYFNKPRIDNHLRVSIGTDNEMDCFLEAIKENVGL